MNQGPGWQLPITIRIGVPDGGRFRVVELPFEAYVVGAALAELSLEGVAEPAAQRMLEMQSILARTYAVTNRRRHEADGFDLCATTHCQLFTSAAGVSPDRVGRARAAGARTQGIVILHDRLPIQAVYHAHCGGHTAAAHEVWSGPPRPYLQAAADSFCLGRQSLEWRWTVTELQLRAALEAHPETRIAGRLDRLEVLERDQSGRALTISVGRDRRSVSGTLLRGVVLQYFGARSLRSTWFDVERQGDLFVFVGRGNGHGAGLCQAGALARARAGQSPGTILRHYFPGTVTARLGDTGHRASSSLPRDRVAAHGPHPGSAARAGCEAGAKRPRARQGRPCASSSAVQARLLRTPAHGGTPSVARV